MKINFEDIKWEEKAKGCRQKVSEKEGQFFRLVEFTADFVEDEWCTKEHHGYIIEGKMKIDFSGEIIEFDKGEAIAIPIGKPHKLRVNPNEKVILILFEQASAIQN